MTLLGEGLFRLPFSKPNRWPNSQDSTGVQLATLGHNRYCWEAVGQARTVFNTLQEEIGKYVEQTSETLAQDVVWSLYMVGRRREASTPTITFISSEAGPRQRLRTLIKESGLLDKHQGFVTMDIDRPPGCKSGVIKLLSRIGERNPDYNPISDSNQVHQVSISANSNDLMGASIYLSGRDSNLVATGGGLVQFDGKIYLTSVAHPFDTFWHNMFPETTPLSDYVFGVDDFSDSDDEDQAIVDVTSAGSITSDSPHSSAGDLSLSFEGDSSATANYTQAPILSITQKWASDLSSISNLLLESPPLSLTDSQSYGDNGEGDRDDVDNSSDDDEANRQMAEEEGCQSSRAASTNVKWEKSPLTFTLRGPTISSANGDIPALDYSLFELPDSVLKTLNLATLDGNLQACSKSVPREPRSAEIEVRTASGIIAGRLLATPSFIQQAQGTRSQQLWTILLEGTLEQGVCGSWVVDASLGHVFGHIVAGAPEDGFAYIIPFYEILDNLNHRFGDDWTSAIYGIQTTENIADDPISSQIRKFTLLQNGRHIMGSPGSDSGMAWMLIGSNNIVKEGGVRNLREKNKAQGQIEDTEPIKALLTRMEQTRKSFTSIFVANFLSHFILENAPWEYIALDDLREHLQTVFKTSSDVVENGHVRSQYSQLNTILLFIARLLVFSIDDEIVQLWDSKVGDAHSRLYGLSVGVYYQSEPAHQLHGLETANRLRTSWRPIMQFLPRAMEYGRRRRQANVGFLPAKTDRKVRASESVSGLWQSLTYTPLNVENREIRLLRLRPGSWSTIPECELLKVSLNDKPHYHALSYAWGLDRKSYPVIINGQPFGVSRSLSDALRQLQQRQEVVTLWVDAVCINQNDNVEIATQIQQMSIIYSVAVSTWIWLGEEADSSDLAMNFLSASNLALPDHASAGSLDIWKARKALLQRSSWSRAWPWVARAAILSHEVVIMCGSKSFVLSRVVLSRLLLTGLPTLPLLQRR